jgi:hypothetical protein
MCNVRTSMTGPAEKTAFPAADTWRRLRYPDLTLD